MTDMQTVFRVVDEMTPEELHQLQLYIRERRGVRWWVVPAENLQKIDELMRPVQEQASQMSEEEVNRVIDEALAEVRRERRSVKK
ncbi:MAG: hypothetical protein BroJett018_02490 [Chloroflexota bacterium]|nr:hypothetical protein [Chloroflexota bacterium]NOG61957.1 hypothetical protein [Chloroflexota bacterium]GIK62455.1 MAG: hypothetical protein BroJett018_02490 [Chloroflexota bacterium]